MVSCSRHTFRLENAGANSLTMAGCLTLILKRLCRARREGSLKRQILVAERNLTESAGGHNRSGAKPASTIAAETRCTRMAGSHDAR